MAHEDFIRNNDQARDCRRCLGDNAGKSLIFLNGFKIILLGGGGKNHSHFHLGALPPPVPPCMYVPDSDPYNFLATYKFSRNQQELLFLPLVEQKK